MDIASLRFIISTYIRVIVHRQWTFTSGCEEPTSSTLRLGVSGDENASLSSGTSVLPLDQDQGVMLFWRPLKPPERWNGKSDGPTSKNMHSVAIYR